eukprot:1175149-Pyramimonas_sp.AAC.2
MPREGPRRDQSVLQTSRVRAGPRGALLGLSGTRGGDFFGNGLGGPLGAALSWRAQGLGEP